ncbi:MAG: hypothetical protein L0Z49_10170 [Actinobacteria bacterium]|nr:hypothetical protein [Actinomycetota bacterium]
MNPEKLREVADFIERAPKTYNQEKFCGTAFCIAGTALLINGAFKMDPNTLMFKDFSSFGLSLLTESEKVGFNPRDRTGPAAVILGLTPRQAKDLFHPNWKPKCGRTVPQELRLMAHRAEVAACRARARKAAEGPPSREGARP